MTGSLISRDRFDLYRFIAAQNLIYDRALTELRQGYKRTHWIWFIFPQVQGLGLSAMSHKFAINSLAEAAAYLEDPLLGARLIECTTAVLEVPGKSALEIFGSPDDLKFRSSVTLFEATEGGGPFVRAIERFFGGTRDQKTLDILQQWQARSNVGSSKG
jgi:uncharacterized protein (DUF1810 family)